MQLSMATRYYSMALMIATTTALVSAQNLSPTECNIASAIGGNGHREGEFIDLSHQTAQIERAALLIYRLSQMNRSSPLSPSD
jgi:hypothetical protein